MKTIAWLMPAFGGGSGGIRTILQNVAYLENNGFRCDIYVQGEESPDDIREKLKKDYEIEIKGRVFNRLNVRRKYDVAIATYYATVEKALQVDCKLRIYFMQDYEPWFFPMSFNYLEAEKSYKYDIKCISIGKWLANKINRDFKRETKCFHFCADLDVYRPLENVEREKAVCFVFQPDKPRRMVDLGLKALQIVQSVMPDVNVYLYGSGKMIPHNIRAEHLGLLSPIECNDLYNKCSVGLCLSATNPSRIPFEMMSAGLPVVEIYGENTIYDLPDAGCILAECSAKSLAGAMIDMLKNEEERFSLSMGGHKYMNDYSLEQGFEEFRSALELFLEGSASKKESRQAKQVYQRGPYIATKEYDTDLEDVFFTSLSDNRPSLIRKLSGIKRVLKEG